MHRLLCGTFTHLHFFVFPGTMDYLFGSLMSLNICNRMNMHYELKMCRERNMPISVLTLQWKIRFIQEWNTTMAGPETLK